MTSPLGKDLLGLERLTADQITLILDTAEPLREISERTIKKVPTLRGATVVNLFFEASTRTRTSFEMAGKRLSADVVNFSAARHVEKMPHRYLAMERAAQAVDIVLRHVIEGADKALIKRDTNQKRSDALRHRPTLEAHAGLTLHAIALDQNFSFPRDQKSKDRRVA